MIIGRSRLFSILFGLLATPLIAQAQSTSQHVIGVLSIASLDASIRSVTVFRQALNQAGFVEGSNIKIEFRWGEGKYDRLPALADELIQLHPDVILANTTAVSLVVRRKTETIPIICITCTDPVGVGLVKSEARPGTNVTGFLTRVEGMSGKQLELAQQIFPTLHNIGVLINSDNPSNLVQRRELEVAAAKLGLSLVAAEAKQPSDIYPALQTLINSDVGLVLVLQDGMFVSERKRIGFLTIAAKMPTISGFPQMAEDGALVSYGIETRENWRGSASYTARILKGEKPADLPMQFPTKLNLTINLIVAKALGVTIPDKLLTTADEVIE
jgi:putative tryptophan/tyrosine transport system substrate-binding protein